MSATGKRARLVTIVSLAVIAIGWFLATSVRWVQVTKPSTREEYSLTEQEIHALEVKAGTGEADAAMRLGLYYRLSAGNNDKSKHWFLRAKELGTSEADSWLDE
ncbi:MAG TPA: hypothetical protein VLA04_05840 [Verrucomicrobiae bacterium]|nr:hypothetical protein [Verrucomicrobiae bacterium]